MEIFYEITSKPSFIVFIPYLLIDTKYVKKYIGGGGGN
jgi:hypothetical protein